MDYKAQLGLLLDAMIAGKDDEAKAAFHTYITARTSALVNEGKKGVNPFAKKDDDKDDDKDDKKSKSKKDDDKDDKKSKKEDDDKDGKKSKSKKDDKEDKDANPFEKKTVSDDD